MLNFYYILLLTFILGQAVTAASNNKTETTRDKKALGIFSVIKFPNSFCQGNSNLNGTCYTSEECSAKSGTASGTCASSFGVCCVFSLECGASSSENCTYLQKTTYSTTNDPSPCTYTICPTDSDVCKLRIDFVAFTIAPPLTPSTSAFTSAAGITNADNPAIIAYISITSTVGPSLGNCITDTFTAVSPGNISPPIICGKNAGQHIYMDVYNCATLSFNIGTGSTTTTRTWSLKVTQTECSNRLADHECLQYMTGTTGQFMSFNFDPSLTATSTLTVGENMQHLANQYYTICFRREENYCGICFSPMKDGSTAIFGSFGVSAAADQGAIALGGNEITCTGVTQYTAGRGPGAFADFIEVDGLVAAPPQASAVTNSISLVGNGPAANTMAFKTCGPFFASSDTIAASTGDATACSWKVPFKWGVHFDGGEAAHTCAGIDTASGTSAPNVINGLNLCEQAQKADRTTAPNGMIGFNMLYWQMAC